MSEGTVEKFGAPLGVRIGLNTGLLMVGVVGGGERKAVDVMGAPVNLASRIQSAAQPGEVLMGASTQRLIGASNARIRRWMSKCEFASDGATNSSDA